MSAIWWIRRDLRIDDSAALATALRLGAGSVVPVFVLDPDVLESRYHTSAERRVQFLRNGLSALDGELRRRGSRLVVRHGSPATVLGGLAATSGTTSVVAERDYSPFAKRRDAEVGQALPLHLVGSPSIRAASDTTKSDGTSYAVFGAFRRAWMTLSPILEAELVPDGDATRLRLRSAESDGTPRDLYDTTARVTLPGLAAPGLPSAVLSTATRVTVGWTDLSSNETAFLVERRITPQGGVAGAWTALATVARSALTASAAARK